LTSALRKLGLFKASQFWVLIFTALWLVRPWVVIAEEAKPETFQKYSQEKETQGKELQVDAVRRAHVRSLAASCATCHDVHVSHAMSAGSLYKIAGLAGVDSADFIAKLQAFKSGERTATVMHHHAKGLNSQEIIDLAAYFSAQTPIKAVALPSQKLLANHAN
jgi:cytochrome c553